MSSLAVEKRRSKTVSVWSFSPSNPISIMAANPAPSSVGAVIGTQIFNSAANAAEVMNDTVRVGGYTAAIATGCQCVADTYRWVTGSISVGELGRRAVRNTTVNSTAVVGGAGGSAVGGAIGTAIFPGTGTVIGSVVGGVCGSIGVGKLVNDKFEEWWRGYKIIYDDSSMQDLLTVSLQYFGFSPNDFKDVNVVNTDTVTQQYKEYARVYHPDKGGTKEEWICLVNHFAILSNAIRKRDKMLSHNQKGSESYRIKRQLEEIHAAHEQEKFELQERISQLESHNSMLSQKNKNTHMDGFQDIDL